ncbi:MAG: polysaccharide biosynthesis/export family protein [bacterium]|nr:polysaccharide biosynthesis/export family protein [bacterium]
MKNKKLASIVLALAIIYQLSTINSFAENFSDNHNSARTAGIGSAFTGLADDTGALWFNPAGTTQLTQIQALYTNLTPYIARKNVPYYMSQSFGMVFPSKHNNAWGFSWNNYRVKQAYQESTILLNYSQKLNPYLPWEMNDIALGLNLKGLFYSPNKAGQDIFDAMSGGGDSRSAFGLDTGLHYKINEALNLGIAALNVNEPPVHIIDDTERLPIQTRVGLSYKLPLLPSLSFVGIDQQITTSVDAIRVQGKWQSNIGTEVPFFKNLFALRGGVNSTEASAGLGLGSMQTKNFAFNIDYSFIYSYGKDIRDRQHVVSIKINRLQSKKKEAEETPEEEVSPYRLGPDDVLQVITRNHDEFSGKFIVDPYGKILIPMIGEIKAEDLTREEFIELLKEEIGKYVQDPNVMVSIMQYRSKTVYILGEVRSPGKYPVEGDSIALRDAIAAAGFPTGLAATWRVYIIKPRTVRPSYKIVNLYKILYRGKMKNNVTLTPGDVVYVPSTMLGKLANSMSYLLDPFFKARSLATPLSTPKPLIDETQTTITK